MEGKTMRKHVNWFLVGLMIGLLTLFAACGNDDSSSSDLNDTENKGSEEKEENSSDEPITLTMFNADGEEKDFDDLVAQKITEKTGVILELDYPVGGNEEAIPLLIAIGEYPVHIFAKYYID